MIARRMRLRKLTEIIRGELLNSDLPEGAPVKSAREFAMMYGTSTLTANRALSALEKEKYIYRVRGSGSFIARRSVDRRILRIGVLFSLPKGDSPFIDAAFGVYPQTVTNVLRNGGHDVEYISYEEAADPEGVASRLAGLDGIVASRGCLDETTFPLLERNGTLLVALQHDFPIHHSCDQVIPDLRIGFKKAMEHLLGLGFSRITIASSNPLEHHKPRIELIRHIAEELGMAEGDVDVVSSPREIGDLGRMSGREIGRALIKREKDPFAVFSLSDFTSFGILDVLRERGIKPGADAALVSFDDLEADGVLPFGRPVVSSISNSRKRIAEEAVSLLLKRIDERTDDFVIRKIPTEFTARESSTGTIRRGRVFTRNDGSDEICTSQNKVACESNSGGA